MRGEMRFLVEVEPRFNYARDQHETVFHERGAVFRSPRLSLAPRPSPLAPMSLKVHNTLTGKLEAFEPLVPGKVGMYSCGVTVYDLSTDAAAASDA